MPSLLRSPRHLFVLLFCLALLGYGLYRGFSYDTIYGENGRGTVWGLQFSPWMLVVWVVAALAGVFLWQRGTR